MYKIIAPTLFQNKSCKLPGIGMLAMERSSAVLDFSNNQIHSPKESVVFYPQEENEETVFNEFTALSEVIQRELAETGTFHLEEIGAFSKSASGVVSFTKIPVDPLLEPSYYLQRVVRPDNQHSLLVGDKETTNHAIASHVTPAPVQKQRWLQFAVILAAIGVALLAFYLYRHGLHAFGSRWPL